MFEKRIQVEEGDHLRLDEMAGNLTISGWGESEVRVRLFDGGEQHLSIEESESGPVVSAQVSCELLVPAGLPVAIRQVAGNLTVKRLDAAFNAEQIRGNLAMSEVKEVLLAEVYGNLKVNDMPSLRVVGTIYGDADLRETRSVELQNIRGNLRARGAGHLRVSRVNGNLKARGIDGNLDAEQVGGNAVLEGIAGTASLDRVAGNLVAKNLSGGAKATRIGGNLVLNGEMGTGRTYQFKVDGNATLRLTEGASAYLNLTAGGNLVTPEVLTDRRHEGKRLTGTLGDGGAEVVVEAKGNVVVGGGGPFFGAEVGEEISRQIEESLQAIDLEAIGRQVSEEVETAVSRLRVKLETADWERLGDQARRAVEVAMERMQQETDRLAERAARDQARVSRRAEKEARRQERMANKARPARHPSTEREQVSDRPAGEPYEQAEPEPDLEEERLSILRMVEQGQLTPEDAEMLMDALL